MYQVTMLALGQELRLREFDRWNDVLAYIAGFRDAARTYNEDGAPEIKVYQDGHLREWH